MRIAATLRRFNQAGVVTETPFDIPGYWTIEDLMRFVASDGQTIDIDRVMTALFDTDSVVLREVWNAPSDPNRAELWRFRESQERQYYAEKLAELDARSKQDGLE